MKVSSYKSDNIYTYGLGATVAMEYLIKTREAVRAVILHPGFRSQETIRKINDICGKDIPVSTEEKPFNILSKKDNCFVIVVIEKDKQTIKSGNHMVLVNPSNCGNLGTIIRSCLGFVVVNLDFGTWILDFLYGLLLSIVNYSILNSRSGCEDRKN